MHQSGKKEMKLLICLTTLNNWEEKRDNEPEIDFYKKRTFIPILANEVFDE